MLNRFIRRADHGLLIEIGSRLSHQRKPDGRLPTEGRQLFAWKRAKIFKLVPDAEPFRFHLKGGHVTGMPDGLITGEMKAHFMRQHADRLQYDQRNPCRNNRAMIEQYELVTLNGRSDHAFCLCSGRTIPYTNHWQLCFRGELE